MAWGPVVGRNDSAGYGVRGFNTRNGYGVLGQAGISGGTGVGGRFENVNSAKYERCTGGSTIGTGHAALFTAGSGVQFIFQCCAARRELQDRW